MEPVNRSKPQDRRRTVVLLATGAIGALAAAALAVHRDRVGSMVRRSRKRRK